MHLCHKSPESPSPMQQQFGTEKAEICFGCITRRCWSFTSMKICRSLKVFISISKLPSSKRERSNTSLIKVAKRLLLFRMVSTIECCSSISSVSCKRDDSAMMACIGVHISWFMAAKKLFRAQIAVSASLLDISSCTFCSIRRSWACINSSRIAACESVTATFNTKRKKERKTAAAPIQLSLSLSLSQIRKKDKNVDAAQCSKQASKQATPEAPHSWSWPSKIVKNLGEELDETDR